MTSIPPGDSGEANENSLRKLAENTKALQQMRGSYEQAAAQLRKETNILGQLVSVFKTSEQLQQEAIAVGTTYNKFVKSNSKVLEYNTEWQERAGKMFDSSLKKTTTSLGKMVRPLERLGLIIPGETKKSTAATEELMVTQQEMTKFMLGAFGKGLRNVSKSTVDLADHMMSTGQNITSLINAFSNLRLLTGNSTKETSKLAETMRQTTRDYGVNADSLVAALQAASEALETAGVYGPEAAGAYSRLMTDLKGSLAGQVGSDRMIGILMNMMKADNIAQQQFYGIYEIAKKLNEGVDVGVNEIRSAIEKTAWMDDLNKVSLEGILNAQGRQGGVAIKILREGLGAQNKLTKDQIATAAEERQSAANLQRNMGKFFQTYAPAMYESIVNNLPLIVAATMLDGIPIVGHIAKMAAWSLATLNAVKHSTEPLEDLVKMEKDKSRTKGIPPIGRSLLDKVANIATDSYSSYEEKILKELREANALTRKKTAKEALDMLLGRDKYQDGSQPGG